MIWIINNNSHDTTTTTKLTIDICKIHSYLIQIQYLFNIFCCKKRSALILRIIIQIVSPHKNKKIKLNTRIVYSLIDAL